MFFLTVAFEIAEFDADIRTGNINRISRGIYDVFDFV